MTANEKAKELIGSYRFRLLPFISFQTQLTETDLLNKCKQCALIAVEEILNQFPEQIIELSLENILDLIPHRNYAFWNEVKKEIEKF